MILSELLQAVEAVSVSGDTKARILGISYDSRKVTVGHLFVAVHGERIDGHDFIDEAVQRGAVAVVCEEDHALSSFRQQDSSVTVIRVKDSRLSLALMSHLFFQKPSESMHVIGVTGTNGKTTVSYLVKSILESWGQQTGITGTIQHMVKDTVYDALHTTPEAPEYQELLYAMLVSGCTYVVSEVSSHALSQKRVDGTRYKTGVYTNLTRDHLDFHKTMDDYFAAKKRLFYELLDAEATAVINIDDPWGRKLINNLSRKTLTYGLETGADIIAREIDNTFEGLRFTLEMNGKGYLIQSPMMGLPNVYNILSAAGVASSLGIPWDTIRDGIRKAGTVKGRFEKVDIGQGFLAIVDYAHTEDALERLIYTARGLTKGRIITVVGCGGDRDRGKRPRMGSVATKLSDFVIFTSDNPRSENPEKILEEIAEGAVRKNYLKETDRKEAIKRSVMMASEGDIVLIAGKGHEAYQEIHGSRIRFNDKEVLEDAIRQFLNHT